MSRRRSGGPGGTSALHERRVVLALLAVTIVLFVVTTVYKGPKIVRGVVSSMGLRRVESHVEVLLTAAKESGLDPYFLAGVMYVESRGQVNAVSPAGALGLFQLMPASASDSARRLGLAPPTREMLLSDPLLNARLAADHLVWLIQVEGPKLERVLVAYNAGRTKMLRWLKERGGYEAWRAAHAEARDSGPLEYARDVLAARERFRARGVIPAPTLPLDEIVPVPEARAPEPGR